MINHEELLFVVNENNKPITPLPRNVVHTQGQWHRASHVWVINAQKQILCQKRSLLKDLSPGLWEAFFGGHMAPEENYEDNVLHELHEELGIVATKEMLHSFTVYKAFLGKEFQGIFYIIWDGNIEELSLEKEEVDEVKWVELDDLAKIISEQNPNWSHAGYEKDFLNFLKLDLNK